MYVCVYVYGGLHMLDPWGVVVFGGVALLEDHEGGLWRSLHPLQKRAASS